MQHLHRRGNCAMQPSSSSSAAAASSRLWRFRPRTYSGHVGLVLGDAPRPAQSSFDDEPPWMPAPEAAPHPPSPCTPHVEHRNGSKSGVLRNWGAHVGVPVSSSMGVSSSHGSDGSSSRGQRAGGAYAFAVQSWGGEDEHEAASHGAARAAAVVVPCAACNGSGAVAASGEHVHHHAPSPSGSLPEPPASAPVAAAASPATPSGSDEAPSTATPSAPSTSGRRASSLAPRIISGALMGVGGAAAIAVKQLFLAVCVFITYHATLEYYSMVTSKGITEGMAPPPRIVSSLTTVMCVSMVLFSYLYRGRSGTVLAVSAFFLLVMNLVAIRKPKFSMLASTLFGVFYCGWLPSFWVKLRFVPVVAPELTFLHGCLRAHGTVGLVATVTTVICVVAADVGAYFVGKTFGRTKLTDISPKKTVEGAAGGLASSVAAALALSKVTLWPATPWAAAGLGVLIFFSSLFGDLIESIIKRDAGMKDSGDLIPGHGGLLDRFDSYMFTGAISYFYLLYVLPCIT